MYFTFKKILFFFWYLEEDINLDIIKNISIFYSKNYFNTMNFINENSLAVCGSDFCGLILIDINSNQIIKSIPSYDNILGIRKKLEIMFLLLLKQ